MRKGEREGGKEKRRGWRGMKGSSSIEDVW